MRAVDSDGQGARVVQRSGAAVLEDVGGAAYPMAATPPDLSDPATLGCLLALVREAHAPAHWLTTAPLMTAGVVHGWRVQGLGGPVCATEAEALVTALEAAP
jgi:hypothetical protein